MRRSTLVALLVAGAAALMFVPWTHALARDSGAQSPQAQPAMYTTTQEKVKRSPIAGNGGLHVPLQLALQLYKKALTRSWSSNPADLDKLVCVWHRKVGSHFDYLYCRTNRQHQQSVSDTQLSMNQVGTGAGHEISGSAAMGSVDRVEEALVGATMVNQLKRGVLEPLLKKLPSTNASYTLRVTGENGKPVFDYVIKKGNLAHIYEYVYKNGKTAKDQH